MNSECGVLSCEFLFPGSAMMNCMCNCKVEN